MLLLAIMALIVGLCCGILLLYHLPFIARVAVLHTGIDTCQADIPDIDCNGDASMAYAKAQAQAAERSRHPRLSKSAKKWNQGVKRTEL